MVRSLASHQVTGQRTESVCVGKGRKGSKFKDLGERKIDVTIKGTRDSEAKPHALQSQWEEWSGGKI